MTVVDAVAAGASSLVDISDADAGDSSLAAEVLPFSGLLDQDDDAKDGGQYTFPVEDSGDIGSGTFCLNQDDTFHLIGLLNSPEIDIARRELGVLLKRLDRHAVEGLTHRLFSALRTRSGELGALLEAKAARANSFGGGARGSRPMTIYGAGEKVRRDASSAERRFGGSATVPMSEDMVSPRIHRSPYGARSPQQEPRRTRGRTRSPEGGLAEVASRSPRTERHDMPQVFRRLTAPAGGVAVDELSRARVALASSPSQQPGPAMSLGGIMHNDEHGLQASAYLQALLEAHELETGHSAAGSRRFQEDEFDVRRTPRVPEEKAKQIFDRLYKSGEEHRVRRRVYHELGVLVEQAKEAQTCTFEPRCPLAAYPGNAAPDGSVTDRLYREGLDRRRRHEERRRGAPAPTFRPQTLSSTCLGPVRRHQDVRREGALSPRDTLPVGDEGGLGGSDDDVEGTRAGQHLFETTHVRLFREYNERKARQSKRQEHDAEWRKHTYRPDISTSQASGPQILRGHSLVMSSMGQDSKATDEDQAQPQQEQRLVDEYQARIKTVDEPVTQQAYVHRHATPPAPVSHSVNFTQAVESTVEDTNMAAFEIDQPMLDPNAGGPMADSGEGDFVVEEVSVHVALDREVAYQDNGQDQICANSDGIAYEEDEDVKDPEIAGGPTLTIPSPYEDGAYWAGGSVASVTETPPTHGPNTPLQVEHGGHGRSSASLGTSMMSQGSQSGDYTGRRQARVTPQEQLQQLQQQLQERKSESFRQDTDGRVGGSFHQDRPQRQSESFRSERADREERQSDSFRPERPEREERQSESSRPEQQEQLPQQQPKPQPQRQQRQSLQERQAVPRHAVPQQRVSSQQPVQLQQEVQQQSVTQPASGVQRQGSAQLSVQSTVQRQGPGPVSSSQAVTRQASGQMSGSSTPQIVTAQNISRQASGAGLSATPISRQASSGVGVSTTPVSRQASSPQFQQQAAPTPVRNYSGRLPAGSAVGQPSQVRTMSGDRTSAVGGSATWSHATGGVAGSAASPRISGQLGQPPTPPSARHSVAGGAPVGSHGQQQQQQQQALQSARGGVGPARSLHAGSHVGAGQSPRALFQGVPQHTGMSAGHHVGGGGGGGSWHR
eukprot:TRINITY_DN6974_c0_g1_i1.p1 TRINITY_DN6974_c0_g1~~TRINITY_DN6974_c0_g1_i1.p1  ORF type:complete len:1118 (-),score=215.46 TRINITY_DN6974_c0_g1_i1:185-3538(-)